MTRNRIDIPRRTWVWFDALRSGDYEQGHRQLCAAGRYCCLGVLERLASLEGVIPEFDGSRAYLSPAAAEWAGLGRENTNPMLNDWPAGWLNDNHRNFAEIANLIEEYL